MDATSKAMFRSRMRQAAERNEKRIDSPLVRYNDLGQPVCKVCNVPVKNEALWGAHLASRQHKEAAEELKERAKRSNAAATAAEATTTSSNEKPAAEAAQQDSKTEDETAKDGALPQGFFDSKEADMKARGMQPQKIDLQEELKEFQKLIEDDVKAVDDRYAEDEAEEAEIRIEEEEVEQVICLDRVDMLKRRKLALEETMTKAEELQVTKDSDKLLQDLSSDDDSDEDLVMDWRAKQL